MVRLIVSCEMMRGGWGGLCDQTYLCGDLVLVLVLVLVGVEILQLRLKSAEAMV